MSMMIEMIRNKITHFLLAIILLTSCRETPVTERKQLILIPESSEMKLGEDAFKKIKKELPLSSVEYQFHHKTSLMVTKLMKRKKLL